MKEEFLINYFSPEPIPDDCLRQLSIDDFENSAGSRQSIGVSLRLFGRELGSASVILVNHALKGNSLVTGDNGWRKKIFGGGKAIHTDQYTVFTEPDPRVDPSEKDVERKLLILVREVNLKKELSEINIQDLVPGHLNTIGHTGCGSRKRRNGKRIGCGYCKT